jgi:hypothetical protein
VVPYGRPQTRRRCDGVSEGVDGLAGADGDGGAGADRAGGAGALDDDDTGVERGGGAGVVRAAVGILDGGDSDGNAGLVGRHRLGEGCQSPPESDVLAGALSAGDAVHIRLGRAPLGTGRAA